MQKINIDQVKELDNSIANLFDIKTISEPTAQKGWSCISYPTQNKLDKADVPTAYELLKDKLDNADATIDGWQNIEYGWNFRTFIVDDNILILNNQNVYKCKIGEINDNTKWVNISLSISINIDYWFNDISLRTLITDKIVCFYVQDYNNGNNQYILVLDRFTLEEIKLVPISTNGKKPNYITLIENYIYFTVNNNTYKFLNSNVESEISPELMKSDLSINNLFKKGGIYYIAEHYYDNGDYYRIFKTNDLTNGTLTKIADRISQDSNECRLINNGNNFIYLYNNGSMLKSKNIEAWADTGSWNDASKWDTITLDFTNFGSAYTTANGLGYAFRNQYGFVITYTLQDTSNSTGTFIYTTDFVNFQFIRKFTYSASIGNVISLDTNGSYAQYNNQGQFYFSQTTAVKTVYTDTINGIDIKYYKNGNYKICTPDIAIGNDDNLQDVFEYLGYLNYWWIDTANEQITLQRNSNRWTMMYVGNNYVEEEMPEGNYSAFATKPLKLTNITASNWIEDDTFGDYGYKCELECNGVNENMFAQVVFSIEEANSGNYASVCDTEENKVIIYSKVNDTITIPTIVIMEA